MTEPVAYRYGGALVSREFLATMSDEHRNFFLKRLSRRHAERLKGKPAIEIAECVREWGTPVWLEQRS